jgi:hypothetical protein
MQLQTSIHSRGRQQILDVIQDPPRLAQGTQPLLSQLTELVMSNGDYHRVILALFRPLLYPLDSIFVNPTRLVST